MSENQKHRARAAFEEAVVEARTSFAANNFAASWAALERAHVLGQPDVLLHVRSHWWMLRCAVRQGDLRELGGQAVRLLLSGPSSLLGRYPRGNNGRSRISMFQPMPVPADLEALLKDDSV